MKHLLIIFSLLLTLVSLSEDYFMDNNGKRTVITEHNYNEKSSFESIKRTSWMHEMVLPLQNKGLIYWLITKFALHEKDANGIDIRFLKMKFL